MDELISDYTMMKLLNYQYTAFNIPKSNSDSIIVGLDGEQIVCLSHLVSICSPLIQSILKSLNEPSEAVMIIPDFKSSEITALLKVMYGFEDYGFVSGQLLDVLGWAALRSYC